IQTDQPQRPSESLPTTPNAEEAGRTETVVGSFKGTEASVASRIPAKIVAVSAQVGDRVTKGAILVSLDDRDLREQTAQARAAAAALAAARRGARPEERRKAEIGVEAAKRGLDAAAKNLDDMKKLAAGGARPRVAVEQAQQQYDTALAQFQQAEQTLAQVK